MHSPLLTIVIPTFRAEKTLQASLDSVLGQEWSDFEVLIMDGGSKDGTETIARRAAEKDDRVRFLSEPDKGVYDAMNKGIRVARGVWIYFLGSDDFLYDTTVLSRVFSQPDLDKTDLLYGNVVGASYKGLYDGEFDLPKLLLRNVSHQAIFYRRALFDRINGYDLRYKGYADWELNIRLFMDTSVRIRYIGGIIARFGPFGLSSRHDVPFLREVLLPVRLQLLERDGLRPLRRLMLYDDWWRLLRNSEIAALPAGTAITALAPDAGRLTPILQMTAWQRRIPRRILKMGICSKVLMFASYCRHLLTGSFK